MRSKIRRRTYLLALAALIMLVSPLLLRAQSVKLTDVIVNNSSKDLLAYFNLRNSFDDETKKALMNGLSIRIVFNVRLYSAKTFWPDKLLASRDIVHSIRYDTLREEFLLDLDGRRMKLKDLTKAQAAVSEVTGLSVVPLSRLAPNSNYELQIKATRKKDPSPSTFSNIISLFSFWNTESDSYTVEFRY